MVKPRIKYCGGGEFKCSSVGSWVGFGRTPERAYINYRQINGIVDEYNLAA